jgi:hypothetical protein
MRRRAERLGRAVEVAGKIWRLEQARLSQIERAVLDLREAEATALQALASIEPRLVLGHIAALSGRRMEREEALKGARARARDCGRRVKLAEKLHADALEAWRQEELSEERRQSQRPVSSPF